jgi:hypothetical protein
VLVGGATRMPLVASLLHGALGFVPEVIEQPELVVAAGCLDPLIAQPAAPGPAPALPPLRPAIFSPPMPPPGFAPQAPPPMYARPVPPPMYAQQMPSPGVPPQVHAPPPGFAPAPAQPSSQPPLPAQPFPGPPGAWVQPFPGPPAPGTAAQPLPGSPAAYPAPAVRPPVALAGWTPPPPGWAPNAVIPLAVVELIELSLPEHQGVTLRGQLRGGRDSVEYVFPTDEDGMLLVFSDTEALGRYAATDHSDPLIATPPWQVRADPSGALSFDFDLVIEHLGRAPEDWLPSFLCRCRDLAAQLALFLELNEVQELLAEYTTVDQVDTILRRTGGGPVGRGGRRRLAQLDRELLGAEWTDLIGRLDAAARSVE